MKKLPVVTCPQCGKEVVWSSESRYRPFCSERCKLIDLGAWANEGYRIPEREPQADQSDDPSGQA
ncbi:MAG: DNA gyrase inhibitor YacG [Nitrosomonadales bacterium]|nr:DNA gyrase inhibitor YacG [Nitrosomonadales bacterium]